MKRQNLGWQKLVKLASLVALGLVTALGAGCRGQAEPQTIKLAHGLPESHPVHQAMVFFANDLRQRSQGRLLVDVYPSEQLGTERECLELVQLGALSMTKVSASVLESFVPEYAVLSLPYLFRDETHRIAVFESRVGARLLESGRAQGLLGLTYYDAGSRSFYTKDRPVLRPDDLQGLKIRTQESQLAMNTVRSLGGAATPIAWGELYTALQQGVVDGAENNPPSFYLSRHYEVCRYYCLDEHTATPDVLLIGMTTWSQLSTEERAQVQASAKASAILQRQLWKEATEEALAAVRASGVEVLTVDKAPFAEAVESLYQNYRQLGYQSLIDDIRSLR